MPRSGQSFLWIFCWVPMLNMMLPEVPGFDDHVVAAVGVITTGIYGLILLVAAWRRLRTVRELEDDCLADDEAEETTTPAVT